MTYVLKNLPDDVEAVLEERSRQMHLSIDVVIEELLVDIVRNEWIKTITHDSQIAER